MMATKEDLRAAARATSSTAIVMRRARIPKRCACGRTIERGERYLRHTLAPNHPDVGNVGWWDAIECRKCVKPERRELFGERCF